MKDKNNDAAIMFGDINLNDGRTKYEINWEASLHPQTMTYIPEAPFTVEYQHIEEVRDTASRFVDRFKRSPTSEELSMLLKWEHNLVYPKILVEPDCQAAEITIRGEPCRDRDSFDADDRKFIEEVDRIVQAESVQKSLASKYSRQSGKSIAFAAAYGNDISGDAEKVVEASTEEAETRTIGMLLAADKEIPRPQAYKAIDRTDKILESRAGRG